QCKRCKERERSEHHETNSHDGHDSHRKCSAGNNRDSVEKQPGSRHQWKEIVCKQNRCQYCSSNHCGTKTQGKFSAWAIKECGVRSPRLLHHRPCADGERKYRFTEPRDNPSVSRRQLTRN